MSGRFTQERLASEDLGLGDTLKLGKVGLHGLISLLNNKTMGRTRRTYCLCLRLSSAGAAIFERAQIVTRGPTCRPLSFHPGPAVVERVPPDGNHAVFGEAAKPGRAVDSRHVSHRQGAGLRAHPAVVRVGRHFGNWTGGGTRTNPVTRHVAFPAVLEIEQGPAGVRGGPNDLDIGVLRQLPDDRTLVQRGLVPDVEGFGVRAHVVRRVNGDEVRIGGVERGGVAAEEG